MERETYIVLRVTGMPEGGAGIFEEGAKGGLESSTLAEVEYAVETESLDSRDYRDLRRDPQVASLAPPVPVRLIQPVAEPDIPGDALSFEALSRAAPGTESATWGVQVTGALESPYTGRGVIVAVLDTGIDAGHEAFAGMEIVQQDFTGEGDGDLNGHGTHVAGTIFGRSRPSSAGGEHEAVRYSVAPGVQRALIGKVLDAKSGGSTQTIADGIQWAVVQGAHIVNMSLGIDFPGIVQSWVEKGYPVDLVTSRALAAYRDNLRLFDRLVALIMARASLMSGALLIAAAGNESRRQEDPRFTIEVAPPATADGVVSVGALQSAGPPHRNLTVAAFSNTGPRVAGPGRRIYSAKSGGGYHLLSGTSMASPHVAGIAALWAERQLQRTGTIDVQMLRAQLEGRATTGYLAQDVDLRDVGAGLVVAPLD